MRHRERRPVVLRQTEDTAEEDRDHDDGEHQIASRHALADLEIRHFARKVDGHDGIPHGVQIREYEQSRRESGEEAHNECSARPCAPELERAGRLEPLVIDVDLCDGARHEQKNRCAGNGQEDPSPLGRRHQPLVTRSRPANAASLPSRPGLPRDAEATTPRSGRQALVACSRRESIPSRRRTARVRRPRQ